MGMRRQSRCCIQLHNERITPNKVSQVAPSQAAQLISSMLKLTMKLVKLPELRAVPPQVTVEEARAQLEAKVVVRGHELHAAGRGVSCVQCME